MLRIPKTNRTAITDPKGDPKKQPTRNKEADPIKEPNSEQLLGLQHATGRDALEQELHQELDYEGSGSSGIDGEDCRKDLN